MLLRMPQVLALQLWPQGFWGSWRELVAIPAATPMRAQRHLWLFADPNASSAAIRTMPSWQASSEGEGAEGVRLKDIGSSIA